LTAALKDKSDKVRRQAAWALAQFGTEAAPAQDALAERLKGDPSPEVRASAAYALSKIGPQTRPAVPALLAAIRALPRPHQDASSLVAKEYTDQLRALLQTLEGIAPTDAASVGLLTEIVSDDKQHPWPRTDAARALGRIGGPARSAFDALLHASWSPNDELRSAASDACYKVDPEAAKTNSRMIGRKLPGPAGVR
jgi:HEAT repeat protein